MNDLNEITSEDFSQLLKLDKACRKEQEKLISHIMIGYFERRPRVIYKLAQLLMARRWCMEAP